MSARDEVTARLNQFIEKFNEDVDDAISDSYTEKAIVYMDGKEPIVGRQAIKELMAQYSSDIRRLQLEEVAFFEQFNDNTAYMLAFTKAFDKSGKLYARYKGCCLWRKIDGTWYVDHDIFNELPK